MKRQFLFSRHVFFILSTAICLSFSFASQKPNNQALQKLDARLQRILTASKTKTTSIESASQDVYSVHNANGDVVYPCFIYADNFEQIRSSGIHLNSVVKDFATARLTINEIEQLSTNASVKFITPTTMEYIHNDVAGALSGADMLQSGDVNGTQYTGSGVIVGIIDTGIDWDHLDFRDPADATQSRILYIWDQTITITGAETTPASFAYGVQYTKTHINNELDGSPAGFVRESDINGHGTHVAGTAAGNGKSLSTTKYKGIAPEADIIVVKAGNGSFPTTNIVDAISYMDEIATAAGKPLVINMSLGSDAGPHDGKDSKGLAVENFSGPGRIAVMSAGNSGLLPIHFTGSIGALDSAAVTFTVPAYTPAVGTSNDYVQFDVWLDDATAVTAKVISPDGHTATQAPSSAAITQTDNGTIYLYNYINGGNGDRNIFSWLYDATAITPAQGTWTLKLINTTGSAVTYHGWLYDYTIGQGNSIVTVAGGNTSYTIDNCSDSAITVGSYASRWRWKSTDSYFYSGGSPDYSDDISSFSSIGPSRTGAQKPDIAAPGQFIVSALSSNASYAASGIVANGLYVKNQGTSMASPVVAGAVALLLQNNPNYTTQHVKSLLTSTALNDSYTGGSLPDENWGYGKLDIFHAMVKAVDNGFAFSRAVPAYDGWGTTSGTDVASGVKIGVKFTSPITGKISGALIHSFMTLALSGPLSAEIWTDNSGLPGSKIGSTSSVDQNWFSSYSWNAIDMSGSGVSVASGTDYHLVLYYNTSGTEFSVALDVSSSDNRSSVNSGSGWSAYGSDFRIRPVMMTDISTLPVELLAFNASLKNNNVLLEWNTATEVNNYGFEIQRSPSPTPSRREGTSQVPPSGGFRGAWEAIGFVAGNGNSNSPKSYSFTDAHLNDVVGQATANLKGAGGKVIYRLKQIDNNGQFEYSQEVEVMISQKPSRPAGFALMQNYPNPFNPTTNIQYSIPNTQFVTLKVYDVIGREAATLVNEIKESGEYAVEFDASNLASGIYFYKLHSGSFVETKSMVLIK